MIGYEIDVHGGFDAVLERVTQALAVEGFGVITRIDMDRTFKEKLGVDFRRYVILGACNPQLAHKAVSDMPEIGLLLPCNVTVEATEGGVRVRLLDPARMIGGAGAPETPALSELVDDAGARLARVAKQLSDPSPA